MSWAVPQATLLPDGKRLHLHHGPIDLVVAVSENDRDACFVNATKRFQSILTGLAGELDALRQPMSSNVAFTDPVAGRMAAAVSPYGDVFVTPMAAVAGAVADEVLETMLSGQLPLKASVNNGGDIAFHLSDGGSFNVLSPAGRMTITAKDGPRGIATSGWQGRSHSLGIADAVTVVAKTAAAADVAATLIANAVDLPRHAEVQRCPANELSPDSDLGTRAVTTHVGQLPAHDISEALQSGVAFASRLAERGLIHAAALSLQGQSRIVENSQHLTPIKDLAHA